MFWCYSDRITILSSCSCYWMFSFVSNFLIVIVFGHFGSTGHRSPMAAVAVDVWTPCTRKMALGQSIRYNITKFYIWLRSKLWNYIFLRSLHKQIFQFSSTIQSNSLQSNSIGVPSESQETTESLPSLAVRVEERRMAIRWTPYLIHGI